MYHPKWLLTSILVSGFGGRWISVFVFEHPGFQNICAEPWLEGSVNVFLTSTRVTGPCGILRRIFSHAPEHLWCFQCDSLIRSETHSTLPQPELQTCLSHRDHKYAAGFIISLQNLQMRLHPQPALPHSFSHPRLTMRETGPLERSLREWEEAAKTMSVGWSPFPPWDHREAMSTLLHLPTGCSFYWYNLIRQTSCILLFQSCLEERLWGLF